MPAPHVPTTPFDVDAIAHELARVAALAQRMPRSWDGAKVSHGFTAPNGANLGRVLPGRGVALASDLKSLGITRPIPHVFEKSLVMRAVDACGGRERLAIGAAAVLLGLKLSTLGLHEALGGLALAITDYDGIINGRANGKADDTIFYCGSQTTVNATWHSLVRSSITVPGGTFAPAAIPGGSVLNRATTGALSRGLSNPSGADKKYLITIGYTTSSATNMVILADLLAGSSGISANTTSTQTVGTPALTRYAGDASAGNLITCEVTTALGATASNLAVVYTSEDGTTGRTAPAQAMTTSSIVGRLQPVQIAMPFIPFFSTDIGARAIEAVGFSAAMGAGVLNAYIYRPLHFLPGIGANIYVERDSTVQIDGLTELVKGTDDELGCLSVFTLAGTTSSGAFTAFLRTVAG